MNEREKLIELLKEADKRWFYFEDKADYLLANGVIVPSHSIKLGDTVYIVIYESAKYGGSYINEETVVEISSSGRIWTDSCEYDDDDIGNMLFATREDAEKALEEGRGCNDYT